MLKVEGKDRVVIDVVKLDDIQGGFYNLFVEFPEEEIARRKEFIVYEEERLEEFQALYFQLKLQPYTDEEAARIGEELSIISSEQQMELYYKLDNSLKPYYVYKFWKGLDPDATTEENEFKDEFYKRLEYVKDQYTISNKKGWNTDMGRVYMKYGPPDEVTSEPTGISSMIGIDTSTFETQPTEAWVYDQVGYSGREMVFIFVDFGTDGIYNIFSSTEPGYGRLLE
jgi:GWxTD domain-containing protein